MTMEGLMPAETLSGWEEAARVQDEARLKERRERIATAVLAGMASVPMIVNGERAAMECVWVAIKFADTLIAELDK